MIDDCYPHGALSVNFFSETRGCRSKERGMTAKDFLGFVLIWSIMYWGLISGIDALKRRWGR